MINHFINAYYTHEEMQKEAIHLIRRKKNFLTFSAIWFGLFVSVYLLLLENLFRQAPLLAIIFTLFFVIVCGIHLYLTYNRPKPVKISKEDAKNEIIFTFSEKIQLKQGKNFTVFEYTQIIDTKSLEFSFALILNDNRWLLLDYHGFKDGNFDDFKAFIHTKCPNLKGA